MPKTVAVGIQDFEEIIERNCFYIDKTHFIKEWWENGDSVTLLTRPRRFGKTLNMSMVEKFFSIAYKDRGNLFEGLFIWNQEEYRMLQGTYPVISLSFANVKETNYASTKTRICQLLADLYDKHYFLLTSGLLTENEKKFFLSVSMEMDEVIATLALHKLSDFLYRYYNKKVIILLDEYDTPMQEAYVNGFWDELAVFTRSLFNATFKTNPYLSRAIMTGITRVSKESIFSDLNHLKIVTTTSEKYATSFGFTEKEVFLALEEYGFYDKKEEVKRWYNGFTFGTHTDIYNPWSVLNFLATGKLEAYWANTSSNRLISKILQEGSQRMKLSFETLLKGDCISCAIDEQIVYSALAGNETAVWSLLLASGYLKVVKKEEDKIEGEPLQYSLKLTNGEVKDMFFGLVRDWFGTTESSYNDFVEAMLRNDLKAMNVYMNDIAMEVFSCFDTGRRKSRIEPERFYHGFVLGLMVELKKDYFITSNRESGFGRYDVMLEPKDKRKNAMILEFKVHEPEEEQTLQDTVNIALKQIEEKQYKAGLLAKGFESKNIYEYGFAFEGKKILIGSRAKKEDG